MALIHKFPISHQLIKFILVGSLAATVHLSCLHWLVEILAIPPLGGNIIAFIVAFAVSYSGQSSWTFNHKSHGHGLAILRFLAVQLLCSFILNQGLFSLLLAFTGLHYMLASFIVLLTVPLATYTLSKYWAFK